MHLRLNPQVIAAMAAGVLLLGAIIYFIFSSTSYTPLGSMRFEGEALVHLRATCPDIGPFESFNVNPENPFLPQNERQIEAKIVLGKPVDPDVIVPIKPPTQPPKPVFPKLQTHAEDAPKSIGLTGTKEQAMVLVRNSDGTIVTVPLHGTWNSWVLMEIEHGNQVVWTDPTGALQTFPIGDGTLVKAQTLTSSSKDGNNIDKQAPADSSDKVPASSSTPDKTPKKTTADPAKKPPTPRPKRDKPKTPTEPSAPDRL